MFRKLIDCALLLLSCHTKRNLMIKVKLSWLKFYESHYLSIMQFQDTLNSKKHNNKKTLKKRTKDKTCK